MGKKSREKKRRKWKLIEETKEKIQKYKENFPLNCKGKTLSQIIEDYCLIFDRINSEWHYKEMYTAEELNSVYNI